MDEEERNLVQTEPVSAQQGSTEKVMFDRYTLIKLSAQTTMSTHCWRQSINVARLMASNVEGLREVKSILLSFQKIHLESWLNVLLRADI